MKTVNNKLLILSLVSYLLGGLIFAFGVSLKQTVPIVAFFIIGSALLISGISSLYKNYQKDKIVLYLFLSGIGVFLELMFLAVTVSQII